MSDERGKKRIKLDTQNEDNFDVKLENSLKEKISFKDSSWENILYKLLQNIEKETSTYLNHDEIIEDLKFSIKNNTEGTVNKCVECGIDMGRCNPRQLCGKTFCEYIL